MFYVAYPGPTKAGLLYLANARELIGRELYLYRYISLQSYVHRTRIDNWLVSGSSY